MILLYILAAILILVVVLNLVAPKNYHVSRNVEIEKPKTEVFHYLKFLQNQSQWSPWEEKDPNMQKELTGTDGEVGAVSRWKGNKQVGEGEQEIKQIIENEEIKTELRFLKPWKSTSDAYIKVEDKGENRTKVTWGFSGKSPFPMNIFMLFMNMDKAAGKDFEHGLTKLKTLLEKRN